MRRSSVAMNFSCLAPVSSRRRQRSGSQTVRRPTISSSASSITITSNTCVTPPVGSGSAGTAMSMHEDQREAALAEGVDQPAERLLAVSLQPPLELV